MKKPITAMISLLLTAFLNTLSVGDHTLTALFKDGLSAEAKFSVTEKESVPSGDTKPAYRAPKTGVE
ncbi:MAG: hypothetical protein K5648_02150 [Erysipelotrichaceae bacterium]|nr:hypothetical protein [Erysipelotrichaceae bacterium]